MMRPSDAALLKKSQIDFAKDLSYMDICLLGFKTDGLANGETCRIQGCSVPKICPVCAMHQYILHNSTPAQSDSVFGVGAQRISRLLAGVIKKAGLDTDIFTARCF